MPKKDLPPNKENGNKIVHFPGLQVEAANTVPPPPAEPASTKETIPWALRMRSEGALRTLLQFCDEGGGTYNGYTRAQIELALMYCRK